MPEDDTDEFKYDEDNDEGYRRLCDECRSQYGPKRPEKVITSSITLIKLPKEMPSITSIRITQTKPRVGWSTLPGPDDGTTFSWFTKTTTHTETETETETTTKTASITISLRKSTATSMGMSESSATSDPEETDTPPPSKKNRSTGGQIAGIVIGVISSILFTALIAWKYLQRLRQPQPDQGPEDQRGHAGAVGGSSFDDSDSGSDRPRARALAGVIMGWFNRNRFRFPIDEPEEPGPQVLEERVPSPGSPPPIPVQPGQAPADVEHAYSPRTPPAIPEHQVWTPSAQVPAQDPAQDRTTSSIYSQDSGYPNSLEIPRPLSIHRSYRRQEEHTLLHGRRTNGEPVQTRNYGWI
jgi:hypothetical protein